MKAALVFWMSSLSLLLLQPLYAQLDCVHLLSPQSPVSPQGTDHIWWATEQDSFVVIEAENLHYMPGFWSTENELEGTNESGYLEWKNGDPATSIDDPGTDILSYFFFLPQGTYRLIFHSAAPDNIVGFVPGSGTTTETRHYAFTHSPDNAAGEKVRYRLKQIDFDGTIEYSDTITLQMPLANTTVLHKAYPNPFNPSTTLSFSLPVQSEVQLNVYDMSGRLVQMLLNETQTTGYHRVSFTAATSLPSGTFIYKLTTANFTDSGIITFLK